MKYTTYRYWFKYGNEDDSIECTAKEWDSLDKAIAYAHRYAKGTRFESTEIENENGQIIYRVLQDSTIEDFRNQLVEEKKKEMTEKLERMSEDDIMEIAKSAKRVVIINKNNNEYRVVTNFKTTPQGKWKLSFISPNRKLTSPKEIIEYIFERYKLNFETLYIIH